MTSHTWSGETDPCPATGHPTASVFLVRCHHRGAVSVYYALGSAEEPEGLMVRSYGPFDTDEAILDDLLFTVTNIFGMTLRLFREDPNGGPTPTL